MSSRMASRSAASVGEMATCWLMLTPFLSSLFGRSPLFGIQRKTSAASGPQLLSISATADRDALPDPATYAECMEQAFQELLAGVV